MFHPQVFLLVGQLGFQHPVSSNFFFAGDDERIIGWTNDTGKLTLTDMGTLKYEANRKVSTSISNHSITNIAYN